MTLFAYKNAKGAWRVSHLPPKRDPGDEFMLSNFGDALMIVLPDDKMPLFFDNMQDQIEVQIGPEE